MKVLYSNSLPNVCNGRTFVGVGFVEDEKSKSGSCPVISILLYQFLFHNFPCSFTNQTGVEYGEQLWSQPHRYTASLHCNRKK